MHRAHITALRVLSQRDHFPEVVVTLAEQIIADRGKHRQKIKSLWDHHHVLKAWVRNRKAKIREASESQIGISWFSANRHATQVTTKEFGPHVMSIFHTGKQALRTEYHSFNLLSEKFISSVKLVEEHDIAMVLRYLACVNAERVDTTLEPVGYLRWIDRSVSCEILAWRLLQSSTNH